MATIPASSLSLALCSPPPGHLFQHFMPSKPNLNAATLKQCCMTFLPAEQLTLSFEPSLYCCACGLILSYDNDFKVRASYACLLVYRFVYVCNIPEAGLSTMTISSAAVLRNTATSSFFSQYYNFLILSCLQTAEESYLISYCSDFNHILGCDYVLSEIGKTNQFIQSTP